MTKIRGVNWCLDCFQNVARICSVFRSACGAGGARIIRMFDIEGVACFCHRPPASGLKRVE